jgi:phosphoenolpyruvate carboxylase
MNIESIKTFGIQSKFKFQFKVLKKENKGNEIREEYIGILNSIHNAYFL